ncbi:2,3-dimethylmalate lyase [compost metagenome]
MTAAEIDGLGFRIAIFPGLQRYAAGYATREALRALKRDGNTGALRDRMLTMREYNEVLGLDEVEKWEEKYLLSR